MQWLWDNVYLSKDERDRYLFLCAVFVMCLLLKLFFVFVYEPAGEVASVDLVSRLDMVAVDYRRQSEERYSTKPSQYSKKAGAVLSQEADRKSKQSVGQKAKSRFVPIEFAFDPNTVSKDSLKLLGFSSHAVNSLLKYRSKGGKIRSVEQLRKVNGLDEETYLRLASYVKLPSSSKLFTDSSSTQSHVTSDSLNGNTQQYAKSKYKRKNPQIIEINSADTSDFMNFYGIGSVYANRIISFRNSLGGFFSVRQVGDTWGISDSLYQTLIPFLTVDTSLILKQDINTATKDELNKHPYIDWNKSKHILNYKRMHGSYKSIDDLYKLHGLEERFVDTLKIYYEVR